MFTKHQSTRHKPKAISAHHHSHVTPTEQNQQSATTGTEKLTLLSREKTNRRKKNTSMIFNVRQENTTTLPTFLSRNRPLPSLSATKRIDKDKAQAATFNTKCTSSRTHVCEIETNTKRDTRKTRYSSHLPHGKLSAPSYFGR